jgi:hypothetical protein
MIGAYITYSLFTRLGVSPLISIFVKVSIIEFLDGLSVRERAKVFAAMEKLVELKSVGIPPKENLSKHLEDGIFELRVCFGTRIARSFYFYEEVNNERCGEVF